MKPIHCFLVLALLACASESNAQIVQTFEDQQVPAGWVQSPSATASWITTNTIAAGGNYSLRSAPIDHGASAGIAWSTDFAPGQTLSFLYRMQSEDCCDHFRVWIDGNEVFRASGSVTVWTEVRRPIPEGNHTIEWIYSKDGSVASGEDAVFIDEVRVGAALPVALPLLQEPGAMVAVRSSGTLVESYFPEAPERNDLYAQARRLAFAPDGTLYLAGSTNIYRYDPITAGQTLVTSGTTFVRDFVATSTQLIGGQDNYCGGYALVFIASGSVFQSAPSTGCESPWATVARSGSDFLVLQDDQVTRRPAGAIGSISQALSVGPEYPSDLAVDVDGSLWTIHYNSLVHHSVQGTELGRYPIDQFYINRLAIREDGLIGVAGDQGIGFMRPDHGFMSWRSHSYSSVDDLAFVPGVVADVDDDSLPLWWEQHYGLDPESPDDAALDPDGDTLTNEQEYAFHSKPNLVDSDGDVADDALEFGAGTNPLKPDTDGDGLNDGLELVELASNPLSFDSDNDELSDYYEFTNGLDLLVDDRTEDLDNDGLTNQQEFEYQTHPSVADSDADGLLDGPEFLVHHTSPLASDSDNDGLLDGAEVEAHHTNPLLVDSDADSLSDFLEVVTLQSNPNNVDSDSDGMPDAWEHEHTLGPTTPNAEADADSDGLTNGEEFARATLPRDADTDNDQLLDGIEVAAGANPQSADTDGDRLPDGWEFGTAGFNVLVIDSHQDQDADGFSALEEVWSGSSDGDAGSAPAPQPWSTHQGNARHNGYQPMRLGNSNPELLYKVTLNEAPNGGAVLGADRLFYVDVASRALVALDDASGIELWRKTFSSVFSVNPPAFADGRVYLQTGNHSSDTYLHAFDGATGNLIFKSPHDAQWERYLAPTVFGDFVYVNGGHYGGAYAFHRTTGVQEWFSPLAQYDQWTPAVEDARVYAYVNGRLEILDRATGTVLGNIVDPLWAGYGLMGTAPVIGGYGNVLACDHTHLVNFEVATRSLGWTHGGCEDMNPATANGLVFYTQANTLVAISELTGQHVWTKEFDAYLAHNLVTTREHIVVSEDSQTHLVRINDQAIVATFPGGGTKTLAPDGRLVIAGHEGIFVYYLGESQAIFFDSFE